ncbi:MAG: serine/threonine-protein kinase [Kofleriaceae bacterium]
MSDDTPTRPLAAVPLEQLESGETLPAEPPELTLASPAARLGSRVGRYLLEDELGRGGMGVVYAAFDPELDRRIAIKVLRSRSAEGTEGRARLQREAQALAKLDHPNVVAVYDVGAVGSDVFVAMELATGGTLRSFQRGRPWREIVRAYIAAGRGLAAAHAAGLIHRDFKPDNVLVGGDGGMRVTDFGLVRSADRLEAAPLASTGPAAAAPGPGSTLTEAGAVMGTPIYMAPEQMVAGPIGPAVDQFAFAVALWQALHRETPFAAADLPTRHRQIVAGELRPARAREVTPRVQRALVRALAADPSARWPTLTGLLDELEAAVARRRPGAAIVVGGAAVTLAGVAAAALWGRAAAAPCAGADAAGVGLWSTRRAAVERAFAATGAPYAAASFGFLDQRLADLERTWRLAARASCADTRVHHTQSPALRDQRDACLAVRRQRAVAVIERLTKVEPAAVADVASLAREVPRLDDCTDPEVLAGLAPRPREPAAAAALTALEARLVTLDDARAAAADVDAAVDEGARLAYPPVQAEALMVRARHAIGAGEFTRARKDLVDAAAAATRGGDRARLADAYLELLALDGDERGDLDAAASWSELAAAAVDALGRPPGKRAQLALSQAALARAKGDPGPAIDQLQGALALADVDADTRRALTVELAVALTDAGDYAQADATLAALEPEVAATLGADHPSTLTVRYNRARLNYLRGDYATGITALTDVLAARERVLGPDHPAVASTLEALAACENKSGRSQAALGHFQRAVDILRAQRGPEHPDTLSALSDLAGAYSHLNDHGRALTINQELLAVRERTLGADHIDVGVSLVNTAIEAKHAGQLDLATTYQARALAIFEQALGADHPNVAVTLINYGETLRAADRLAEADAAFVRAGEILDRAFGSDHILLAHVWYGRGMVALAAGRAAAAVGWLERAVARRAGDGQDPNEQAEAELGLAKALVAARRDRARAVELARHAIATWGAAGSGFDRERAAAEAWLATAGR